MALTPDVVSGTIIQSSWGNQIRDRTVQQFASIAERNVWTAPPKGAMCVTTDTNAVWQYSGTAWVSWPLSAKGLVAHGIDPATSFAATSPVQCGGTFPAEAGRMYRYEASAQFWSTVAATVAEWSLKVNGTLTRVFRQTPAIAAGFPTDTATLFHWSASPGNIPACSFAVDSTRANGTGAITFLAGNAWSWAVYDVGPAVGAT